MELPNYRMPGAKKCRAAALGKSEGLLERAFTVIFLATIVIWCLQTFDTRLNVVTDSQDSLLAMLAGVIAPVFAPLGFGDWRISTAPITGFHGQGRRRGDTDRFDRRHQHSHRF